MKTLRFVPAILFMLSAFSCSNPEQVSKPKEAETSSVPVSASLAEATDTKTLSPSFANIDPAAAEAIHSIIGHYLATKNALASDNAAQAADAAGALRDALTKVDKSLLTAEQKVSYDKAVVGIRQEASLISDASGDIARQRGSFFPLSESVYALAKQFGGGRTLYHDHCPMARDNQGALWISEQKDIRNPYFGSGMLTCGTVVAVIQ